MLSDRCDRQDPARRRQAHDPGRKRQMQRRRRWHNWRDLGLKVLETGAVLLIVLFFVSLLALAVISVSE
jgi:hypothetical protein